MSGGHDVLSLKEEDVRKMLCALTHIGSENVDYQMEQYVYKRRQDGVHIINIKHTWEKLLLAARAIAAIEHLNEVFVISSKPHGQRAVLKFAAYTGATPIAGRFTPGAFTNQIQSAFREPRLLVVTDPRLDHQPITEASYVNIPVIALCNTDSPLRFVDIAIPCNNKTVHSIGLMWWMLAREVLRLKGLLLREGGKWDVIVDMFFYRDPDEEKEEQVVKEAAPALKPAESADYPQTTESWAESSDPAARNNWADEGEPAPAPASTIPPSSIPATEEWSAQGERRTLPATEAWSAQVAGESEWQGGTGEWAATSATWNA